MRNPFSFGTVPGSQVPVTLPLLGLRYFRTGDLGRMIDNRFLKLTGRVNELYKLENGKFVMPSLVESAIGRSNYISQNCVIGANRPFNIALIVPDMIELTNWMKTNNIQIPTDPKDEYQVLHYSEVINLYQSEVLSSSSLLPLIFFFSLWDYEIFRILKRLWQDTKMDFFDWTILTGLSLALLLSHLGSLVSGERHVDSQDVLAQK